MIFVQSRDDGGSRSPASTPGSRISVISLPCVFQGRREFAGVAATGIFSHQGQSQPRGLHAVLQVRPGQGTKEGAGGLQGVLGGAKGRFIPQLLREQLL